MNIEHYVAVNFNAMIDVIDTLGGLDIELTEEEVKYTNMYCDETAVVTGVHLKKTWLVLGCII